MKRIKRNKYIIFFLLVLGLTAKAYPQEAVSVSGEVIELSSEDVIKLVLSNSLDIQIAKYDAYISRTSLEDAQSIFDVFFTAEADYNRNKKVQNTILAGSEAREQAFSLGLEKKLPTGTTVSLDAAASKVRTDITASIVNPYNEALVGISLTQELGKNFFGLADRSEIKITKLDIENSEFTSLDDIEEIIYKAQESYWNLVLKNEERLISEDMLKSARTLYDIYKNKRSLGLVEESELLAIEALAYTRENDFAVARLEQETVKNNLLFLINKGEFEQKIKPKDNLDCQVATANLYEALKESIFSRRDYKQLKNELKKNKIDLVVKKNALWPQIDLEATFSRNNINSQRAKAWEGIADDENDEVSLKLTFKVPLQNRKAKAELEKTNLIKKQLLLRLKRLERLILQEINTKVSQVNTAGNQVQLYSSIIKLHQKKLDNQIKRIGYGRSNADTLIQYEEDLLKGRLSLAASLYTYRVRLIELDLIKNVLLDKYWQEAL